MRPLSKVRPYSEGALAHESDNTFAVMPRGTKVISAESCGISAWTKTGKISVRLADGIVKRYFLKVRQLSSRTVLNS